MVTIIALLNLIILHVLVVTATAFPILYAARSNWRQTRAGQAQMVSTIALALLVDVSVAGHYLHHVNPLVGAAITFGVLLLILVGTVYKLVVLLCAQHRSRIESARSAAE